MQNGYNEGDKFVTEETLHAVGLKECLNEVARSIGWEKKERQRDKEIGRQGDAEKERQAEREIGRRGEQGTTTKRGKGLACMIKATITPSVSCAVMKLNEDASLSIYTGTV